MQLQPQILGQLQGLETHCNRRDPVRNGAPAGQHILRDSLLESHVVVLRTSKCERAARVIKATDPLIGGCMWHDSRKIAARPDIPQPALARD